MIAPLNIVAPIGAFGNHLRWLLLLDPSFKISVGPNEYYYNEFAGPDWPDYQIYCKNDHTGISSKVLEEIKKSNQLHNFLNTVQYNTIDEKINFHKLQRLQRWEGDQLCETDMLDGRIKELFEEKENIKEFLAATRAQGKNYVINGVLEIKTVD